MRPQGIFQLLFRLLDRSRDLHRFKMIVFKNLVDGVFGNDPVVRQRVSVSVSDDHRGHPKDRFLEHILIVLLSLPDLFVKPTQSDTSFPQSLEMSSV